MLEGQTIATPRFDAGRVNLLVLPHFDPRRGRTELSFDAGVSLADMVPFAFPGRTADGLRLTIGEHVVPPENWARVRPVAGSVTVMRVVPGKGGLRSVLTVAVTVAAIAASTAIGNPFLAAAASTAILAGGTIGINLLIPQKAEGGGRSESPTYRINGWKNVANPNGVVPLLLGKHRVAPPYAALPWTEMNYETPSALTDQGTWTTATSYVVDDHVYAVGAGDFDPGYRCIADHTSGATTQPGVGASWATVWALMTLDIGAGIQGETDRQTAIVLFNGGYGPQQRSNYRIGETQLYKPEADWADPFVPEFNFEGVEIEFREGEDTDTPVTLYPSQVLEDALGVTLDDGREDVIVHPAYTKPVVRMTAEDTTEVSVDIFFPEGLGELDAGTGDHDDATVEVKIRQREFGETSWSDVRTLTYSGFRDQPFGHSERWELPSRGQWEIEVSRTGSGIEDEDDVLLERVDWVALKSFRPEYPIALDKPLVLTAMKIRASKQLQGTLDAFSYDAQSVVIETFDGFSSLNATSNPASLFRHVLQGNFVRSSVRATDAEIDLDQVEAWHAKCVALGLEYNRVHDFDASLDEVLDAICAAGRARKKFDGVRWSVAIDEPQSVVVGAISPRNSWGFEIEPGFAELPDAFLVAFKNELESYSDAERLVPRPGDVRKATRAALFADLAWPAGSRGEVYGDATPSFDGVYLKSGAPGFGAWTKSDPEVIEALDLPGVTHPAKIWKEARWRWRQIVGRPDLYSVSMDWEHMIFDVGSLAKVSHHILDRVQVSARVKSVDGAAVTLDQLVTMEDGESYALRYRRDDASVLRPVVTIAGETDALVLTGSGTAPQPGDLAQFGKAGSETLELIVQSIERGDNLSAVLRLVDHAPEIEADTEADTPPAFTGRVGPIIA